MIKKITPFVIAVALFTGLFWLLSQPPKESSISIKDDPSKDTYKDFPVYDNPDLVFYWGNGCPHCENVEKWITENKATEKLKINFKEVYYNSQNQKQLLDTVKEFCPDLVQNGGVGVPTGFDPATKKCVQGDTPIIELLSSKIKK